MEKNYNINDELEQYLKDEAEGHKMYPSEHVWENIRTELHGNPAWPALTFVAITIILVLSVSTLYNYPPKTIITKTNSFIQKLNNAQKESTSLDKISAKQELLDQEINPNNYTLSTIAALNNKNDILEDIIANETFTNQKNSIIPTEIIEQFKIPANYSSNKIVPTSKIILINEEDNFLNKLEIPNQTSLSIENNSAIKDKKRNKYQKFPQNSQPINLDMNTSVDKYLNEFGFETKKQTKKLSGFEIQFYVTPSTSYRKLEDDKIRLNYSAPTTTSLTQNSSININNSVHHTPALGMEIGVGILYNLTPNFKVKTGLQFNIRQYYIDASKSYGMATIAFVQNNHLDSISLFSMFGNATGTNGYYSTKIDNKLYQISIPIGFQWDFIQGKKLGVSASASIQPTFTLNKNVYMISTDYKYYANGEPFFRKWNFNTCVELNITYKTGNVKWYAGPQIRYQHLPTYNDVYPIKEYRLDYGFKIGIATPIFK